MKFACAVCHVGQAKALVPVVQKLVAFGHEVSVIIDRNQPVWGAYQRNDLSFPGASRIVVPRSNDLVDPLQAITEVMEVEAQWMDKALVMLSPTKEVYTVERALLSYACREALPGYVCSEVPCGQLAPVWSGQLHRFSRLFLADIVDVHERSGVISVGMVAPAEPDIRRAYDTKRLLGIGEMDPWIWYMGGPYAKAGEILQDIVRHVRIPIVFSRHGRDKQDPHSTVAYKKAVAAAYQRGVSIQENSLDHGPNETTDAQRVERIAYWLLLEACSVNGILITGHGTDGIKAPYVGIPSILCVGDLNPHIFLEKGCSKLPLPDKCPWQVMATEELRDAIAFFQQPGIRGQYERQCRELYPAAKETPAEIIVRHITS